MKEDLIEHIKSQLSNLEIDYHDGAWERFNEKRKQKRGAVVWRASLSAAAVLIFCLGFVTYQLLNEKTQQPHGRKLAAITEPRRPDTEEQLKTSVPENALNVTQSVNDKNEKVTTPIAKVIRPLLLPLNTDSGVTAPVAVDVTPVPVPQFNSVTQSHVKKMNTEDFLVQETISKYPVPEKISGGRKWSFAFSVGQAIDTRSKTDLSAGMHISYLLNDRLSLVSGIFFNQLGGARKNEVPDMKGRTDKFMTGTQASLAGVDVPLEFQYKATKQLYARIGVSAYAIVSQQQTLDYLERRTDVNTYVGPDGSTRTESVTVSEVSTESVPTEKLKQRHSMVGLYNLSIGWKQKLNDQHSIAFEPYVKIPLAGYSDQKLNLVQGGLRLKVDF
ncbi:hypothetical protein IM792_17445 [Mucilaginibacter sp. JRF]|uniref:outer membrane beta-barrel protein n=1 Tax=Mucilaginibacter sp. JRF TaxID=2780088 RepID=UPI00187F0C3A|nr:outer membrane beta-barrel protein [Mucilaginibacter sp. JRF]MBE9586243.1 hypothetical protein [Mucilaginibacter sp. JRF]